MRVFIVNQLYLQYKTEICRVRGIVDTFDTSMLMRSVDFLGFWGLSVWKAMLLHTHGTSGLWCRTWSRWSPSAICSHSQPRAIEQ
jgi:hypothetical protein